MKKRIMLFTMAIALFACSCGKNEITARYYPRIQESSDTKAIWHEETTSITWEDGDELQLTMEVRLRLPEDDVWPADAAEKFRPIQRIVAKMVYDRGKWTTFRRFGESWIEVEYIAASAPSTEYEVSIVNMYDNRTLVGDDSPERFQASVRWRVPFKGGDQVLDIIIPFSQFPEEPKGMNRGEPGVNGFGALSTPAETPWLNNPDMPLP